MPQLVKKRRSGWAVLAAGALVASLLAVGASPVGAATDSADHEASTSTCVGDATGDQMYTDVSDGHAFADAINCIGYYGVTNGTGDGSTFSPNDDVTRAQMAVFIARAAGAAGVDLGDAMDAGFGDIGDVWQEAQDAINQLADNDMIPSGDNFRPDDAITRAEMATFLVGLLAEAAPNVTIDSNGAIQLGTGGNVGTADDYFGDSRASQPRANDAQISAIYELGITKGASAAAGAEEGEDPLDYNYEPAGTVNRGEMAAFITRALDHTSVRPSGVSAQHAGGDVVVSVRDENFAPMPNVVVDIFRIDTGGIDLAFRGNGSCGEVDSVGGTYPCEIDGADPITGDGGDTSVALGDVDEGGTTVWAWTGDHEDTATDGMDGLYRLDVSEADATTPATQASLSTEFAGSQQKLGSSVLYTLQLQDGDGDAVTVGTDGKKPARYLASMSTRAFVGQAGAAAGDADGDGYADAAAIVTPLPLTTDSDGKASITVSAPGHDPAPTVKSDKYEVTLVVIAAPGTDPSNAPATLVDGDGEAVPAAGIEVVFSTEPGVQAQGDIGLSVEPSAEYSAVDDRGASNRVTVTVTDKYGDPIVGVRVMVTSADADADNDDTVIGGGRAFAVGRDGSYTFGYERDGEVSTTETFTATMTGYDHDGDGCSQVQVDDDGNDPEDEANDDDGEAHRCNDLDGDGPETTAGTAPLTQTDATATVEWAAAAEAAQGDPGLQIQAFDTETNTIFVGDAGSTMVLYYDSNDRFNIDRAGDPDPPSAAASYAGFERTLSKAAGYTLEWGAIASGSRATNNFTLNVPAS